MESPQNEQTPVCPVSPYGVAKAFAVQAVRVYRESFGMFACNAICFNHESPRRSQTFVSHKITQAAAKIKLGLQNTISLGNLDAARDWGFAGDYVEGMWKILQHETPSDFVLATGVSATVREFLEIAFTRVGLNWQEHVEIDSKLLRRVDSQTLVGDASKARDQLGWESATNLTELIAMMVDYDLEKLSRQQPN
jgi:GDPmannose 4,6-dehydratase